MYLKHLNKIKILIIAILLFIIIQSTVLAYFIDSEPIPEYCDDCIIPLKEEIMANQEMYQIFVILSMVFVNALKTYGMYLYTKQYTPDVKFNNFYIISAILGVFIGYSMYIPTVLYEGTYINIFMDAGKYAIGLTLLFDFAGKAKENGSR